MSNKYLPSTSTFTGEPGLVCGLDGVEINKKARGKALYNKDYFAYLRLNGFNLDAINRTLTTIMPYPAMGRYLTKENYLVLLPLFVAKLFIEEQWYNRDIYATTSDGGDTYTKDANFLKSCLIYTCLSNQNKCLSLDGSDGRRYQNELCLDNSDKSNLPLALQDLQKFAEAEETKLDDDENNLLETWNKILEEAKKIKNYNPKYHYGIYQITKELNTSHKEGTGKNQKIIYDYPSLNGYLETLKTMLKEYYKTHITEKMFKYELIK